MPSKLRQYLVILYVPLIIGQNMTSRRRFNLAIYLMSSISDSFTLKRRKNDKLRHFYVF